MRFGREAQGLVVDYLRLSPVRCELAALRPVLVIHLLDEHLDLLRTDLVGVDERLSDASDEPTLLVEVSRRLLHCDDGQSVAPSVVGTPPYLTPAADGSAR